jgi:GTP-binding protein Era
LEVRRAGCVAFVGAPNAGKSSIINALLGAKAVAVSGKPQTTRNAVRCVLTEGDYQIVVIDTPGIHKPRYALGEFMDREISSALESVDAVCLVADASRDISEDAEMIYSRIENIRTPIIIAANKIDKLRSPEDYKKIIAPITARIKPAAIVPVSAKEGTNLDALKREIASLLPEGEAIYPADVLMDATERFLAEEIIRERVFESTEQEVPHSVAVVVEEFKSPAEYPGMTRAEIRADIIVERPGQKGILIGEGGSKLKAIRQRAKTEMEDAFGCPVALSLWVRVKPQWRKTAEGIRQSGYRRR